MKFGLQKVFAPVTNLAGKAGFKVKKYSPEICLGAGIVGIGATVVLACKATLKADEVLDNYTAAKEKIEKAKEASKEMDGIVYEDSDAKRDKAIAMKDLAIGFTKLYWPAAAVGVLSIGLVLSSYGIMKKRNLSMIAAYTALDEGFKRYRGRVKEKFGEEAEKEIRTGIKKAKGFVVEEENGKEKVVEKDVLTMDDVMMEDPSDYAMIFSEATSTQFVKGDPIYNESFLKGQEAVFNNLLKLRGYVLLADVYQALGFPRTPASLITGWIKDSANGDNYISFGIRGPVYTETGEHVMKTGRIVKTLSEKEWYLDFNVDGVIWNLI